MSISYKNRNVDKGASNNNVPQPGGGTIQDVSGSLTRERVSQQSFNEALAANVRGSGSAGQTDMYTYDRMVEVERFSESAPPLEGAPSIFNTYAVFTHPNASSIQDFFDIKGADGVFPKYNKKTGEGGTGGRQATYQSIITDFDPSSADKDPKLVSTPYYASDFLYARWFNRIPMNRLITLRRYPFPTYDNLAWGEGKTFKPTAQAVTWFGEPTGNDLKELLKYKGTIAWKDIEAEVHEVEGNEQGFDSSPFVGQSGKLGTGLKFLGALGAPGKQDLSGSRQASIDAGKYNNFEYTNRVLGPVNVVKKTSVRDRGIGAEQEFSIVFEYQLRSYNNINPRLAMVDLLANMLALTFNNAKFWGGANRYFPNSPQFGFLGDQKAFYDGRYGEYIGSVVTQLGDGLGKGLDMIGNLISGILSGDLSALTGIAKGGGSALMDLQARKTRPQVLGFHALLTGLPVGEWHVTIGNPYRPIAMIGNLICSGFDFEMDGQLGVDDFPDLLKFTVNLKNGRPRDKGDLESIFTYGEGRSYYPPSGFIDVTNSTSATGKAGVSAKATNPSIGTVGVVDGKTRKPAGDRTFIRAGDDRQDIEFARKLIGTAF